MGARWVLACIRESYLACYPTQSLLNDVWRLSGQAPGSGKEMGGAVAFALRNLSVSRR